MKPEETELLTAVRGNVLNLINTTDWDLVKSSEITQKTVEVYADLRRAVKKIRCYVRG